MRTRSYSRVSAVGSDGWCETNAAISRPICAASAALRPGSLTKTLSVFA